MFFDVAFERFCRVFASEAIRVVIIGQEQHFQVHALHEQHVRSAKGGMNARSIAVVDQGDVAGETVERMDLVNTQGRPGVGHNVLYTTLVHGNHVGVALDHIDAIFLRNGLLGLIDAIKLVVLVIDITVGRVDILLIDAFRAQIEYPTTEAHHLTADTNPRKNDAPRIAVDHFPTVVSIANSGLEQEFVLITLLPSRTTEGEAVGQIETQSEFADNIVAETTRTEILHSHRHTVNVMMQHVLEIACGPLVHDEHTLAQALFLLFFIGQLALFYLYMILAGQPPQRLGISHLLVLHDETYRISALSAPKTMARATSRRHIKRRCFLVVERTQALIVAAALAQRNKLRHHINDVRSLLDSFNCQSVYHR